MSASHPFSALPSSSGSQPVCRLVLGSLLVETQNSCTHSLDLLPLCHGASASATLKKRSLVPSGAQCDFILGFALGSLSDDCWPYVEMSTLCAARQQEGAVTRSQLQLACRLIGDLSADWDSQWHSGVFSRSSSSRACARLPCLTVCPLGRLLQLNLPFASSQHQGVNTHSTHPVTTVLK